MPSASASQRPTRNKRLPAPPVDEITLRVVGTEHHGRLVRITAAKCTVGTAPSCTLRLKANGVAPIHCLILRGPNGVVVRRLADNALLNGRPFDDAPLEANDRLDLGGVSFVVVQVPLSPQAPEAVEETAPQPPTEETRELVRETRRLARRRARNLLNALRAGKRQSEQLQRLVESRKQEAEQTNRQAALLHRELAAQRERQRTVEEDQRAAVLQVAHVTGSLERLRHELLAAQSQRQSEADRWRLDRSRMTEDLALRDARLHEAESQLQQKQWELEQLHLQFQRQQRQLELEHEQAVAARQRRDLDAESSQREIGRITEELLAQDRARLAAESELQTARRELEQFREALIRARKEAADDRAALQADRESRGAQSETIAAKLTAEQSLAAKLKAELVARTEELERLRETTERNVRDWQVERLQIIKQVSEAAAQDAKLLTDHREQLDSAGAKNRELETLLADSRVEFAAVGAEVQAIRAEAARLNKTLADRDAELARLRTAEGELTAAREEASERAADYEQKLAAETAAAEQLRAELSDLRGRELQTLILSKSATEEEAAELETRLAAEREAKIHIEQEAERLRRELCELRTREMQTLVLGKSAAEEAAARQAAELEARLAAERDAKVQVEQEAERLRQELCELREGELQTLIQSKSAAEVAAARQAIELEARLAAERDAKLQAEHEADRLRQELCELRGREMQTMVFAAPVVETPAVDPEEIVALERQRHDLLAQEERLAQLQRDLTAERDELAVQAEQSRQELLGREEHLAAESSRLSAGMHQLQEFEARLVRQQDELALRQRESEAREVAPPAAAVDNDEAGFLMPFEEPAPSQFLEPTFEHESPPVAEEPPIRAVTEPYFVPEEPASTLLEPELIAPVEEPVEQPQLTSPEPEQPAEEQPAKSSAFERRLAALAAEAAKARAAMTPEPEPEPPTEPEPPPAAVAEQPTYETPMPPAISADQLPQWRFEHETPERMDTIAGLRMRNLLDEIKNFPTEADQDEQRPSLVDMMKPPSAAKLQFEPTPAPPPEPEPAPVESPVEEIDIFSRLKEAGILKGDPVTPITLPPREEPAPVRSFLPTAPEEEEPEAANDFGAERVDQTMIVPSNSPSPFIPKQPEPVTEEEDSIENYMQQLLQRVRGDGPPTGSGTNPVYRDAAAPKSAPAESPAKKSAPPPPKPDLTPVKPEEYLPRSAPADRNMNMAAMRKLANSQARSAIQTHQKKVGMQLSGGKLATAVVAVATAVVLVWMGYANGIRLTIGAGGLGFVIGLYWLMQALFLSQGWLKSVQRAMGRK